MVSCGRTCSLARKVVPSFRDHPCLAQEISSFRTHKLAPSSEKLVHPRMCFLTYFYVNLTKSRASGCPTSHHHRDGSGSSSTSEIFEEGFLGHGAGAPGSEDRASTSTCKKIRDSVYELYMPSTSDAEVDILLFHGLNIKGEPDPHLFTWRAGSAEGSIWPQEWLPEDYPNARVLSISYDGNLNKDAEGGRMDVFLGARASVGKRGANLSGDSCGSWFW